MKKGQKLTFVELWNTLKSYSVLEWRFWGVGGTFAYINPLRWDFVYKAKHFEYTDGGHETFHFIAEDESGNFLQEVGFGNYENMTYEIEIMNENPLRISIMWDDGEDNLLTIWEKINHDI